MFRALRKPIAWFLIASMAMVAGLGEGLHYIPGCGHGPPAGNRFFLLGINSSAASHPTDDGQHLERPQSADIPIYDENQCAICSAVGQRSIKADFFQFISVTPLVHDLPAVVLHDAPAATVFSFQARAPPLA